MMSCFVRDNSVPNTTSTTVTVTIGAHTAVECVVLAISGANVYGITAILQNVVQANQAGSTTPTPTFGSIPFLSSCILSAVGNITNPPSITISSSVSAIWTRDQNVGQTACGLIVEHTATGHATAAVAWGGTSASAFASMALEVGAISANTGVNASKLIAYAAAAPPIGVACSKLIAYAALGAANTNPPVWPSLTFPAGYVLNPYSYAWDLAPASPATTYTLNSGSLPPGTALHSPSADLGNVSGTPTLAGVYTFTLLATNAYGTAVSPSYSITISAPAGAGGSFTYAG
jgi:hypothetical protein